MSALVDIILQAQNKASSEIDPVTGSLKKLDSTANDATSKGLSNLRNILADGIKVAATAATAAIGGLVAGLGVSVSKAASAEQGLADISAQMGLTSEETDQFKKLIQDLSMDPKLKVTSEEAAAAIGVLGTAGVSVEDILNGAARSTVLLANATGSDFSEAATIASDAMKMFNIDAADMDGMVNQIVGTTVASKMGIHDYGLALSQGGGVAATTGVAFEDFNAVLAGTAHLFSSGSDGGTSFKSAIANLQPGTVAQAQMMRNLGFFTGLTADEFEGMTGDINKLDEKMLKLDPTSKNYQERLQELKSEQQQLSSELLKGSSMFYDEAGNMRSAGEIADRLKEKLGGMSEMELGSTLDKLWGPDGARTVIGLMNLGSEGLAKIATEIAATDAAAAAATRMDTFSGSVEIAMGLIDGIAIGIGDGLLPVLRPLIDRFSELAAVYGPMLIEKVGEIGVAFNTFMEGLAAGQGFLGTFHMLMRDLLPPELFDNYLKLFSATWDIWMLLQNLFTDLENWETEAPLIMFLNDLGDVIRNSASFVIGIIDRFVDWKDVLIAVGAVIAMAVLPAIAAMLAPIAALVLLVAEISLAVGILRTAWDEDWLGIRTTLEAAWGVVSDALERFWDRISWLTHLWREAWQLISNENTTLGEKLVTAWNLIVTSAKTIWGSLVQLVVELYEPFKAKLVEWGTAAWKWIQDAWPKVVEALGSWASSIISWLGGALPGFLVMLLGWGTALYKWIGDAIPNAINSITDFIKGIRGVGDEQGGSSFGNMVSEWASILWKWITEELIPQVGPAMMDFIGAVLEYGGKMVSSLWELTKQLALLLWDWIVVATPIVLEKLGEWWEALKGYVTGNLPGWITILGKWAYAAWKWLEEAKVMAWEKIKDWGEGIWKWVKENLPQWVVKLKGWAMAAWEWIVEVTPKVVQKLGEWGRALWDWLTENLPDWLANLGKWALAAWDWIVGVTPTVVRKLGEWGRALWDWLVTNMPDWVKNLGAWAAAAWDWIVKVTPLAVDKLLEWGTALWTWITDHAQGWADSFLDWAAAAWEWIVKVTPEAVKKLGEWGIAVFGWLATGLIELARLFAQWGVAAWQWIVDIIPTVKTKLGEWWDAVTRWYDTTIQPWVDKWTTFGRDIIEGLRKGIQNKWNELTGWFSGIWNDLTQGFKNFFGIHSPSTVFADFGGNLMDGLAQGISDGQQYVARVLEDGSAVWENMVTGKWIPLFEGAGQDMFMALGDEMRSQLTWVKTILEDGSEMWKSTLDGSLRPVLKQYTDVIADFAKAEKDARKAWEEAQIAIINKPPPVMSGNTSGVPASQLDGNNAPATGGIKTPIAATPSGNAAQGKTAAGYLFYEQQAQAEKLMQTFGADLETYLMDTLTGGLLAKRTEGAERTKIQGYIDELIAAVSSIVGPIADSSQATVNEAIASISDKMSLMADPSALIDLIKEAMDFRQDVNKATKVGQWDFGNYTEGTKNLGAVNNVFNIQLQAAAEGTAGIVSTIQLLNDLYGKNFA